MAGVFGEQGYGGGVLMKNGYLFQEMVDRAAADNEKIFQDFIRLKGGLEPAIAEIADQVERYKGHRFEVIFRTLLGELIARRAPLLLEAP